MNMKEHILAAMKEQFDGWEELLASLSEAQISAPLLPTDWSVKIVIAHLWTWQQRSVARFQAALLDQEPQFPQWIPGMDPDVEGIADQVNALVYETNRDRSWRSVNQDWRNGYLRLLKLGGAIDEINLLSFDRYAWMHGIPLAFILTASYDHHKEHHEKLLAWLQEHGFEKIVRRYIARVSAQASAGSFNHLEYFPPGLSSPARRALSAAGITRLKQLTRVSEAELLNMHGLGPRAVRILDEALAELGLAFASQEESHPISDKAN